MQPFTGDNSLVTRPTHPSLALTKAWWEWQDNRTAWTSFPEADQATVEHLYKTSNGQPMDTADLSWNRGFNSMYRYDFNVMTQVNLDSGKKRLLRRREVPCCPKMHMLERKESTFNPLSVPVAFEYAGDVVCAMCLANITQRKEAYYHCSACKYDRCLSCQGDRVTLQSFASLADWRREFTALSRSQVDRLREDVAVRAQLEREGLNVIWRQWLDTERSFGSEEGKATTDITLFAMAPTKFRHPSYGQNDQDFINFPAVRSPNYCDEVDVVSNADGVKFDVKNRHGELVKGVTLRRFLAQLGQFISDLEPVANWNDPIDDTPLQTSSQFSIIPAPTGCADVGIAAFGHQCANLHIVIGPSGDLGWAAERPGAQRVFFRDASGQRLHAISLVPERREEVSAAFFKLETHDETVEEEKQRYESVQNCLIHLQITMDGVALSGTAGSCVGRGNVCPNGHELKVFLTPNTGFICDMCGKKLAAGTKMFGCRPCDFDHCRECWRECAPKGVAEPGVAGPFPAMAAAASGYPISGTFLSMPMQQCAVMSGGAAPIAREPGSGSPAPAAYAGAAPPEPSYCAAPQAMVPAPPQRLAAYAAPPASSCAAPVAMLAAPSVARASRAGGAVARAGLPLGKLPKADKAASKEKKYKAASKEKKSKKGKEGMRRDCDDAHSWTRAARKEDIPHSPHGASAGVELDGADPRRRALHTEEEEEEGCIESGLLLAVVERGAELGPAADHQKVPVSARRKPGVSVRITYMNYGLAADGHISAERTRRFARQADFRRRELGLPHGSLVSGLGSWGGPENAPIKLFGFRLTDAVDGRRALEVIEGVSKLIMPGSLRAACKSLQGVVPGMADAAARAERAAQGLVGRTSMKVRGTTPTLEQVAALYLYTMSHSFYRQLNAAMRDPDRSKAHPFFSYLRLLFAGLDVLCNSAQAQIVQKPRELWRGVNLDLEQDHPPGSEVTWWGASSCTPKLSVAQGFLGSFGARTLFTVQHYSAVPIKQFSAFRGEEEWLLAPGTRLRVENVKRKSGGLLAITLVELPPPRDIR